MFHVKHQVLFMNGKTDKYRIYFKKAVLSDDFDLLLFMVPSEL